MTEPAPETPETTPAEPAEGGDGSTVVVVDTPAPADEPEGGDTTVVVTDAGGDDEGAQDDATQLDHEQRITRLEERFATVETDLLDRPTYDSVQSMMPSPAQVEEAALSAGAAAAEAVIEEHEDEEAGDDGVVRVEATDTAGDPVIATVEPEAPPAADEGSRRRGGIFRW